MRRLSIDSIVDVPDDQGGWVLVHFTRSGRDFADEATLPISSYGIWRRVDSAALVAALETQAPSTAEKSAAGEAPELGELARHPYQGRTYRPVPAGSRGHFFPAGDVGVVATVPAVQQDTYIAAVPTVADSSASGSNHTVFVMTAHTTTPSIWYVSEPDSGYSVDNIAPGGAGGFAVAYNTGSGNHLTWDPCADEDFQYFKIYRGTSVRFRAVAGERGGRDGRDGVDRPDYDGWDAYSTRSRRSIMWGTRATPRHPSRRRAWASR